MRPVIEFCSTTEHPLTCDQPCYDATKPRETCICGGNNYNVGHDQALRNNLNHYHRIIHAWLAHISITGTTTGLIQLPHRTTISFSRNPR